MSTAPRPAGAPTSAQPAPQIPHRRRQAAARTAFIAQAGVIAAAYAATTLVCMLFMGSLAWGPVQFRLSEALTVLALFTPAAVPGLTLGCALANLANIALGGTGLLGLLDVVFGSLATFLAALWLRRFRTKPLLALAGPVVANALIVPAYLPLMLMGLGFYTIPFTGVALDGVWWAMYLFGLVATAIGEAVVLYALGLPLQRALAKSPAVQSLEDAVSAH